MQNLKLLAVCQQFGKKLETSYTVHFDLPANFNMLFQTHDREYKAGLWQQNVLEKKLCHVYKGMRQFDGVWCAHKDP